MGLLRMKKMIVALISMLVLLAACTSNNNEETSTDNTEREADTAVSEHNKEPDKEETSDEEINQKAESPNAKLASFPEYDVLVEEIDMDNLAADVKTNNPNKRVMILTDDDGEKQYKSIYIKEKQRLKIISLDEEGQIFNKVIK